MIRQKENSHHTANAVRQSGSAGTPTKNSVAGSKRGTPTRSGRPRDRPSTPTTGRGGNGVIHSPQPLSKGQEQQAPQQHRPDDQVLQAVTAVKEIRRAEPLRSHLAATDIHASLQALRAAHAKPGTSTASGKLYSEKEVETFVQRLHQAEVDLINTQEDCLQYQAEYEKIKEEGCALYDAYMVKCNTVKDLQQRLETVSKERDLAHLETGRVRIQLEEQVLLVSEWQLKCTSQAEKFKESFRQYKTLKEENSRLKVELDAKEDQLRGVKASRDSLSLDLSTDKLDESSVADLKQMEEEFRTKEEALLSEIESLKETVDAQRALLEDFEYQAEGGQEKLEEATTRANKLNKAVKKKRKLIKKHQNDFKSLAEDLVAAQRLALEYSPSLSPINTEVNLDISIENCSFGSSTSKDEISDCEERVKKGGSPRPSRRRSRRSVQTPSSFDLDSSVDEEDSSILNESASWLEDDLDRSHDELAADNSDIGSAFNFDVSPSPLCSFDKSQSPEPAHDWQMERTDLLQRLEEAQESIETLNLEREELLQENEQLRTTVSQEESCDDPNPLLSKAELSLKLEEEQKKLKQLEKDMVLICQKHKDELASRGEENGEYKLRYQRILQHHSHVLEQTESVGKLHEEIASFQSRVQELCELLEDNTGLLLQKEASIRVLQSQIVDSTNISERVAELERCLEEVEAERDDLRSELSNLKTEKNQFMEDFQQISCNLNNASLAKTELGQLCSELRSANLALEAKLAEQDARSLRTTEQLEEETKALQLYSEKYLILSDRYDALLSSMRKRDNECETLRGKNSELLEEAERCATEAAKLEKQVTQLTAICGEYEAKITELTNEKTHRHTALEEATAALARQETDVRSMRSEVKMTRQEKECLSDELSRQREVNEFLNTERDMQNQHIEELEQEFEEVQHKLAMLEVQQTHSQDTASKHQRHVLDKIQEAEAKCSQLSEELTTTKQKAAAANRAQEQQLQAYKKQLEESASVLQDTQRRMELLQEATTSAANEHSAQAELLCAMEKTREDLEGRCQQLQAALQQREEANASLNDTLNKVQQRKADLKEKLHRAMRQGSELQTEYDKLVETQQADSQHVESLEENYQQALKRVDSIRIQANEELIQMATVIAEMEQEVENHLIELKLAQNEKEELALQLEMLFIVCEEQELLSEDSATMIKRTNELEQQASALSVRLQAEDKRCALALQQVSDVSARLSLSDAQVKQLQQSLADARAETELLDDVLSSVKDVIQEHKQELMATGASDLCALVDQMTA